MEEDLLSTAEAKRRLEKLVIRKGTLKTMGKTPGDGLSDIDKEALRALLLKDGEVYRYSGDQEILSDADIATLLDRYVFDSTFSVHLLLDEGADGVLGVMPPTSRQRGETATRTSSPSSRRVRTASRRRRRARVATYCMLELEMCFWREQVDFAFFFSFFFFLTACGSWTACG